jgi:glyoxylase-like metal-dependent hydrolase (beta-lactamase superfamily II)
VSRAPIGLLRAGSADDPLVVVRSDTWGYNSIGFFSKGEACVIDPGLRPEDIELLASAVMTRATDTPRRVSHVVVTHAHHDHIRGWNSFPGAEVLMPRVGAEKELGPVGRILDAKRDLDDRFGLSLPDFAFPTPTSVCDERLAFRVGELDAEVRFVPGHSNCTSVVWIPALRTLCTADYLVSPGLPYCRWEPASFETAIATMRSWTLELGIERIVPAHHDLILGQANILDALDAESAYFAAMRAAVQDGLTRGEDEKQLRRTATAAGAASRSVDYGVRAGQDRDNARRVVLEMFGDDSQ